MLETKPSCSCCSYSLAAGSYLYPVRVIESFHLKHWQSSAHGNALFAKPGHYRQVGLYRKHSTLFGLYIFTKVRLTEAKLNNRKTTYAAMIGNLTFIAKEHGYMAEMLCDVSWSTTSYCVKLPPLNALVAIYFAATLKSGLDRSDGEEYEHIRSACFPLYSFLNFRIKSKRVINRFVSLWNLKRDTTLIVFEKNHNVLAVNMC